MKAEMRALRAGWALAMLSCAPAQPAYTLVLSPGRYEVRCEDGFRHCQRMAARVCEKGYDIEASRTDAMGSAMRIRCAVPKAVPRLPAPAAVASSPPESDEEDEPTCTKDYQCTALGSRCIKGMCVIVPVVMSADDGDRCIVGNPEAPDPVPMFPTASALTEFLDTPRESRAAEFMLVTRLNGTWVDVGVRCRTLGQFARGKRIQLVSGALAGRDGWMATPAPAADAGAPDAGVRDSGVGDASIPDAAAKRASK